MKRILIVLAHPDAEKPHYCHALAEAYQTAAEEAGHGVRLLDLGKLDVPLLRSKSEWQSEDDIPEFVVAGQEAIYDADHLLFIYPLWLGTMPALLKAWLEQVLRESFAFEFGGSVKTWRSRLKGRSARIVITMGMPAFVYRWFFLSHSLRSFERNILKFCGIKPIRTSLIGLVDSESDRARRKWLQRMREFGRAAS